ncbi:MAG: restriction endonuclease subunit S [Paludibacteraceae bacterium]|nr:restriction endonuclease subunit S [Paludibacteraceae bacterium]
MTHNWTYKKLGEVGQVITGSTPTTKDERNYSSKDVCFFKPSDFSSEKLTELASSEFYISSYAYEHSRKLPKDSVLTTCIGIIGKVGILTADATCNQQINAIIPNKEIIVPRFLGYSIISIKGLLSERANAPVVPLLNKSQFSSIEIPIPSLLEQESIVAELDAINHLIDLQEKQLREYDRLAQSLFYSTFGDPTNNPKGWEVKKLSDVVSEECKMSYGIVQPGDDIEDGVPVVRPIDFKDSEYIQRKGLKKTLPSISDSYKRTILRGDEILICVRGTTGTMGLATPELKGCNVTRGIVPLYFRNEMNKWFMYKYLKSNFAQNIIAENTYGATLKQINISALRSIPIMCPPLALQQTFAAQIEAIEQQKALIRRSLDETRTLLAARMQYYFE